MSTERTNLKTHLLGLAHNAGEEELVGRVLEMR